MLATTCENTQLIPSAQNLALVRASVLCLINHERAENGVAPLKANAELEQAAEGHCSELIEDDYFAHVSPSGLTPVERIEQTGYVPSPSVGYVIGENLAWGTYELATPQSIVAAWIASPEHLANILEAQYRETGVGVTPAVPSSLSGGSPGRHLRAGVRRHHPLSPSSASSSPFATLARPEKGGGPNVE